MIDQEIDSRMMQFRQNPQALQQRYSQTQDLLDLLALQKLKSEKEAAARDMQLKMAQQQAANGMPPTIKGQREQEVLNLTKQELMQQRGALAKEQQADQQKNLQEVMQKGLPQAPAPNMQNLAGGGIVAFGEGGDVQHFEGGGKTSSPIGRVYDSIFGPSEQEKVTGPAYSAGVKAYDARISQIMARLKELGGTFGTTQQTEQQQKEYEALNKELQRIQLEKEQLLTNINKAYQTPAVQPAPAPAAQPPAAAQPDAAAQPTPAPAAQSEQSAAPTIPGPKLPASAGAPPMEQGLADAIKRAQGMDPQAQFADRQKAYLEQTAEKPEEKAIRMQGEAARQQAYQQMTNPEQQKRDALYRGLMSAAGGGGFAAAGTGMMNAQEQQRKAQQEAFDRYQNPRETFAKMERERRAGSFGAGEKAETVAKDIFTQGIASATQARGQDLQYSSNIIAQQVEMTKARIMAETNAITKQGMAEDRARAFYASTQDKLQRLVQSREKQFQQENGMLLMQEQAGALNATQKAQLSAARKIKDADILKMQVDLEPVLQQAATKLGLPGGGSDIKFLGKEPAPKK